MNALAKVNVFSALVLVEIGLKGGFSNIQIYVFLQRNKVFSFLRLGIFEVLGSSSNA